MAAAGAYTKPETLCIFLLLLISFALPSIAGGETCESESTSSGCHDRAAALKLKVIAFCSILVTSLIGVCLPLFTRAVPALQPDKDLFVIVKCFASGVILATGYMHVMPDSFDDLRSPCLPDHPWKKFPFTTFVAMLSAVVTLMVDSFAMSYYKKSKSRIVGETANSQSVEMGHHHVKNEQQAHGEMNSQLLRHRVIAQVLELGIVVHSVVIGMAMGASENPCTIRPLIAALCFHQLFEGMGLGGCILQAEYEMKMKGILVFFFSATTPIGIVLGIGLTNVYSDTSPTSLIVVGLLNASSAGLLNYMALVDLLASDFMGPKLQGSPKLQVWSYMAVLLGAGGMSVMAIWA